MIYLWNVSSTIGVILGLKSRIGIRALGFCYASKVGAGLADHLGSICFASKLAPLGWFRFRSIQQTLSYKHILVRIPFVKPNSKKQKMVQAKLVRSQICMIDFDPNLAQFDIFECILYVPWLLLMRILAHEKNIFLGFLNFFFNPAASTGSTGGSCADMCKFSRLYRFYNASDAILPLLGAE